MRNLLSSVAALKSRMNGLPCWYRPSQVGGPAILAVKRGWVYSTVYEDLSLTVAPRIRLLNRRIGQSPGGQTILLCTITAYPQAVSYWEKDDRPVTSSNKHKIEAYDDSKHTLTLSLR